MQIKYECQSCWEQFDHQSNITVCSECSDDICVMCTDTFNEDLCDDCKNKLDESGEI